MIPDAMLFIIRHAVQRRRWSNEISFWVKVHSPWMFEVFSPEMFDGHYVPLNRALFLFIQIIETEPQGVSLYVIINCQASNVEENCVIWEQSLRQISNVTAACGNIDAVWRRLDGNGVHLICAASTNPLGSSGQYASESQEYLSKFLFSRFFV